MWALQTLVQVKSSMSGGGGTVATACALHACVYCKTAAKSGSVLYDVHLLTGNAAQLGQASCKAAMQHAVDSFGTNATWKEVSTMCKEKLLPLQRLSELVKGIIEKVMDGDCHLILTLLCCIHM